MFPFLPSHRKVAAAVTVVEDPSQRKGAGERKTMFTGRREGGGTTPTASATEIGKQTKTKETSPFSLFTASFTGGGGGGGGEADTSINTKITTTQTKEAIHTNTTESPFSQFTAALMGGGEHSATPAKVVEHAATTGTKKRMIELEANAKPPNNNTQYSWRKPFQSFQTELVKQDTAMHDSVTSLLFLTNELTRVESKVNRSNQGGTTPAAVNPNNKTKTKTTTTTTTKSQHKDGHPLKELHQRQQRQKPRKLASSSSSSSQLENGAESEILFLLGEEEEQAILAEEASPSSSLPDRWLDYFCIVGLDPNKKLGAATATATDSDKDNTNAKDTVDATKKNKNKNKYKNKNKNEQKRMRDKSKTATTSSSGPGTGTSTDTNKPTLLDRFPKEERSDMEFPQHLPAFCFPNGNYHPLKYKVQRNNTDSNSNNGKKKRNNEKINVRYHHNLPEPTLYSMVLTSGSGHRLYCTTLTVYEMRQERQKKKPLRQLVDDTTKNIVSTEKIIQTKIEQVQEKVSEEVEKTVEKVMTAVRTSDDEKLDIRTHTFTEAQQHQNWWEESNNKETDKNNDGPNQTKIGNRDNNNEIPMIQPSTTATSSLSDGNDDDDNKPSEEIHYWMVPKCLVLISHYPFFQAQGIVLKEMFYTVQSGTSPIPFERYVAHILEDIPLPRCSILSNKRDHQRGTKSKYSIVEWTSWLASRSVTTTTKNAIPPTMRLKQPPPNQLPLLDVSMEPLFRTLSLSNILVIWATLLKEGKVVLACGCSGETTPLLTPIAEALLALLFPFEWQGIYIPVLPNSNSVLDVLQAPIPYLIGLVTDPTQMGPENQPSGVLWVDLDSDVLHLGFKNETQPYFLRQGHEQPPEEIPLLPALPNEASMRLKVELEEIVDPLFLPTITGIKGKMTIGDRSIELDNALRQPYAQRTKLFDNEYTPTPRKFILSQASKVPPRGTHGKIGQQQQLTGNRKGVEWNDYNFIPPNMKKRNTNTKKSGTNEYNDDNDYEIGSFCGLSLEDMIIQFPCSEDTTTITTPGNTTDEGKKDDTVVESTTVLKKPTEVAPAAAKPLNRRDSNASQDSDFMVQLKRQGRAVQAHTDRFMAVFGVDYATPSEYATRTSLQLLGGQDDVLNRQDQIAANFYFVDNNNYGNNDGNLTERVRKCFLKFFVATLSRYNFFVDQESKRIDEERFIRSLNFGHRQREYIRLLVTSQMFEIFLSQQDLSSIRRRRLFDEHIIEYRGGTTEVGGGVFAGKNKATVMSSHTKKYTENVTGKSPTARTRPSAPSKFDEFVNRNGSNNSNANVGSKSKSKKSTPTPLLESTQWKKPTIIIPDQPCIVGLREGCAHCSDRRFPDHLNHDELVTNNTISSWRIFWDGTWLCTPFLNCGY